jgi:hypothetical protein
LRLIVSALAYPRKMQHFLMATDGVNVWSLWHEAIPAPILTDLVPQSTSPII